ncbi:N-acetylmuramoyl-L-alanine amidase [Murinocardiopsis flavida]|uniref:N-acetylmuramoyl-L-alanine amidase n=1 Tax=Murinocardiopsis flavida TaxID=645275 RepID=UPI001FEBBF37|nr:N-acetylmuramoyl-L-alanine amidase [Murinocardiopsis flavida]
MPRTAAVLAAAAALALCAACAGAGAEGGPAPPSPAPGADPDDNRGASRPGPSPQGGGAPGSGGTKSEGPLAGTTVAIDPGHNGGNADAAEEIAEPVPAGPAEKECDTVGASTNDGYPEHRFTWDFAKKLGKRLEAEGVKVVYTRTDDKGVGPCIDERAEIGNRAEADAAISIHADGSSADGSGFHVIAPGRIDGHTEDIVKPSRTLAEDVRDQFHELSGQPYSDYLGEDGIDVRTDLGGLNLSTVPKVFLEVGNMRNAEDAAKLTDPEWRVRAADATAAGVIRYLVGD